MSRSKALMGGIGGPLVVSDHHFVGPEGLDNRIDVVGPGNVRIVVIANSGKTAASPPQGRLGGLPRPSWTTLRLGS